MSFSGRFLARESARNLWAMLAGLILSFIQVKSDEHALGQWRNSQEPQGPEFELLAATQQQKTRQSKCLWFMQHPANLANYPRFSHARSELSKSFMCPRYAGLEPSRGVPAVCAFC